MFSNFGFGEIAVLALVGMLIFGPEKLPKAAMDAARVIRKLRSMADGAVNDFKAELPPEMADLDLRSLHPRRIVQSALFDDAPAQDTPHGAARDQVATPAVARPATAMQDYDNSVVTAEQSHGS